MFRRLAVAVALLGLAGGAATAVASSSGADPTPAFEATFDQPTDLATFFDYGYSGPNPWSWGNGSGDGATLSLLGDHDLACDGPTTSRLVNFAGNRDALDFSQLFWQCAPGGAGTGHLMTGVDTISYNTAWFSPKPTFTEITKVCWDINETELSHRKWIQVLFVGDADAHRYPTGGPTATSSNQARGTGGFDLGFGSPGSDDPAGATSGVIQQGDTIAGALINLGTVHFFQGGAFTTSNPVGSQVLGVTDKAARYQQCLENSGADVLVTQQTPSGVRSFTVPGNIPQDSRRVVFEDDNYDPPKDNDTGGSGHYNPANLTWHWDNVQVFTKPTNPPPTTTTTTAATTTAPTTTVASTTTTVPACPPSFAADAQVWCAQVNARLHALDGQ